jgi:hypothetical protein
MARRFCLLFELENDHDWHIDDTMDNIKFVELRAYDMKDHEQCAIQFVRELVIQGRPPDPYRQRIIVIGGDSNINPLEGGGGIVVERVPFTVWEPVAPEKPQWRAKRV